MSTECVCVAGQMQPWLSIVLFDESITYWMPRSDEKIIISKV